MGAIAPAPNTTFIEPRQAPQTGSPRRWSHVWAQTALVAADTSFSSYLGELPPWNMRPVWVEIRDLHIGYTHAAADAFTLFPVFSVGAYNKGYVVLEPKASTGGIAGENASSWTPNIITTGQYYDVVNSRWLPYFQVYVDNTDNNDAIYIYLSGTFMEETEQTTPQSVVVEKIHEWPWVRRS